MTPERWQELKGEIKDKFQVEEEGTVDLERSPGSLEFITFLNPLGKIKLEFVTRPVVLDKKTTTSRRIGAEVKVDYIYSEDEFIHKLSVHKWNENLAEWEKIEAETFE